MPGTCRFISSLERSSTKKSGLLDRAKALLEKEGLEVTVFDEAEPNPLASTAMRGAAIAREKGCDVVVGLGGGSIMDCGLSDLRIEAEGLAGALVGRATGGSLTGNSVSGLLLSAGCSPDGLTGERTGDVTVSDNLSSALIY